MDLELNDWASMSLETSRTSEGAIQNLVQTITTFGFQVLKRFFLLQYSLFSFILPDLVLVLSCKLLVKSTERINFSYKTVPSVSLVSILSSASTPVRTENKVQNI